MNRSLSQSSEMDNDSQALRRSLRERRPPGAWWQGANISTNSSNALSLPSSLLQVGDSPPVMASSTLSRHRQIFSALYSNNDCINGSHNNSSAEKAHLHKNHPTSEHCSPVTPTPPKFQSISNQDNILAHPGQGHISNPPASYSPTPITLLHQPSPQQLPRPSTPPPQPVPSINPTIHSSSPPNVTSPLSPTLSGSTTPPPSRQPFYFSHNLPTTHDLPVPPDAPRKLPRSTTATHIRELQPIPIDLSLSGNSSNTDTNPSVDPSPHSYSPSISLQNQSTPLFMLARRSALHFSDSASSQGVRVATALSVDASILGELRIAPHGTTGVVRTFGANEMYFVRSGRLDWDIGNTRIRVCEGDFLGLPHLTLYEIRNPMIYEASIIFFSPPRESTATQ